MNPAELLLAAFAIDCGGNALLPGAIGIAPAGFVVVEWLVPIVPLDGSSAADIGVPSTIGLIAPAIWSIGDPTIGFLVRLLPIVPGSVTLRVCAPDLVTPLPGACFVIGFQATRRPPTS